MSQSKNAKSEEDVQRDARSRSFKAKKSGQQETAAFDLHGRMALRPREVAHVLGISERLVRQILPELPHTRIGSAVVVPKDMLGEWLRKRAHNEGNRVKILVNEVVAALKEER